MMGKNFFRLLSLSKQKKREREKILENFSPSLIIFKIMIIIMRKYFDGKIEF